MGVKSLWTLLTPVGRPVMLETVEGKAMAIDSSIWIYQFQATMRDKEGRGLINAHVLGFLRRISKLLFYGIKPVFVFDGGAPALKRTTLNERKQKKIGAAASHAKVAEKLLAAQMRREALNAAQGASSSKKEGKRKSSVLDDDTVYLEDLEGPRRTPAKPKRQPSPSSSSKKAKYRDHDPYQLPEVDMEERITKATRSSVPDPRLATEEELRLFIEEMRPEDFDINSPAFRELPTEIKYEIVGDLRLKSRQTSYARLQKMLQTSRTPLDFSKQQIQNLRQRNALTQQLLTTTDSIGSAHIAIPVRIASERNKQYLLVKNEGESGGWILGIRDVGTREKPITIDHDDEQPQNEGQDDSDLDMEEVPVPTSAMPDSDLREYQREMALSAHESIQINRKTRTNRFILTHDHDLSESEGELLSIAIERSLDDSRLPPSKTTPTFSSMIASTSSHPIEDIYAEISPTRLETALAFAGKGHGHARTSPTRPGPTSVFGEQDMLLPPRKERPSASSKPLNESDLTVDEIPSTESGIVSSLFGSPTLLSKIVSAPPPMPSGDKGKQSTVWTPQVSSIPVREFLQLPSDSDEELEEILVDVASTGGSSLPKTLLGDSDERVPQTQDSHPPPLFIERSPQSRNDLEDDVIEWSRTPSPVLDRPVSSAAHDQEWDAAHEMDAQAEEGEFARFVSQVKGKNIDDVRKEIDDEINDLNRQRRAAMRDSEDVTQQMITQIMTMLRLFGIPYITAPMEAEAQCAELLSLNLVDGVITDDSDVFLFGAQRVYKNMFNQSKTVECFLLSDLSREFGLDRDTLIRLAYLLGSDYTEGLPGVGPVVAMELLKEFPGREGLHKFNEWWTKVQSGKDREEDNQSKFRRQFKKKYKNLYIPNDWPNSVVRDAYYHPTVDSSEEPFKWGMPDLDGLRMFFHQELGWQQSKVNDLLLPIIHRMNGRQQATALNKQGDLNEFLDVAAGSGTRAPRQRKAYASRRLQQVISDFRKQQKSGSTTPRTPSPSRAASGDSGSGNERRHSNDPEPPVAKKRKTKSRPSTRGKRVGTSVSRGRGSRISRPKARIDATSQDIAMSDGDGDFSPPRDIATPDVAGERELRPRVKPRPAYRAAKERQDNALVSDDE